MGISTIALLTSAPSVIDLLDWAVKNYDSTASVTTSPVENMYWLLFGDGSDQRQLTIFINDAVSCDYEDFYTGSATFVTIGCWGNSEVIARKLVSDFGGWFKVNDCEDEWKRLKDC